MQRLVGTKVSELVEGSSLRLEQMGSRGWAPWMIRCVAANSWSRWDVLGADEQCWLSWRDHSILHSSCKLGLANSEGWIPQTPLGWCQEIDASWCLNIELVLLFSVGADRSAKIEVFHITTTHCTWWFLSMTILLSFPFTSGVPCLSGWAIVLMHWWLINGVCAI